MEYLYFSKIFLEHYPIIGFFILPFIFIFLFIKKGKIYFIEGEFGKGKTHYKIKD